MSNLEKTNCMQNFLLQSVIVPNSFLTEDAQRWLQVETDMLASE